MANLNTPSTWSQTVPSLPPPGSPCCPCRQGSHRGPRPLRARLWSTPSVGAASCGIHDCPPWCPLFLKWETPPPSQSAPLSSGNWSSTPSTPASWTACPEDSPFPSPSCLEGVASWAVGRSPRAEAPNPALGPCRCWSTEPCWLSSRGRETGPGNGFRGQGSGLTFATSSVTGVLPSSGGVGPERTAPTPPPPAAPHLSGFHSEQQRV